jgi:predicted RNA-binding protein YlqC (UPF0109 family)
VSHAREVVEVIARALVDAPDEVTVTDTVHRGMSVVELFVAPDDLGRVIGRQGRTAAAIRTLVTTAAEREGQRATLEIRDERGHR